MEKSLDIEMVGIRDGNVNDLWVAILFLIWLVGIARRERLGAIDTIVCWL